MGVYPDLAQVISGAAAESSVASSPADDLPADVAATASPAALDVAAVLDAVAAVLRKGAAASAPPARPEPRMPSARVPDEAVPELSRRELQLMGLLLAGDAAPMPERVLLTHLKYYVIMPPTAWPRVRRKWKHHGFITVSRGPDPMIEVTRAGRAAYDWSPAWLGASAEGVTGDTGVSTQAARSEPRAPAAHRPHRLTPPMRDGLESLWNMNGCPFEANWRRAMGRTNAHHFRRSVLRPLLRAEYVEPCERLCECSRTHGFIYVLTARGVAPRLNVVEGLEEAGPLRHASVAVSRSHGDAEPPHGPARAILSQRRLPG
jgi:hypothetical protein